MESHKPSILSSMIPEEARGGLLPIVVIGAVALVAGGLLSKTVNDYEQAAFIEMTSAIEGAAKTVKRVVCPPSPSAPTKTETRATP